jgi:hypothetical protein
MRQIRCFRQQPAFSSVLVSSPPHQAFAIPAANGTGNLGQKNLFWTRWTRTMVFGGHTTSPGKPAPITPAGAVSTIQQWWCCHECGMNQLVFGDSGCMRCAHYRCARCLFTTLFHPDAPAPAAPVAATGTPTNNVPVIATIEQVIANVSRPAGCFLNAPHVHYGFSRLVISKVIGGTP